HRSLAENRATIAPSSVLHRAVPVAVDPTWAEHCYAQLWLVLPRRAAALAVPMVASTTVAPGADAWRARGPEVRPEPTPWPWPAHQPMDVDLPGDERGQQIYPLTQAQRDVVSGAEPRPVTVIIPSFEAPEY